MERNRDEKRHGHHRRDREEDVGLLGQVGFRGLHAVTRIGLRRLGFVVAAEVVVEEGERRHDDDHRNRTHRREIRIAKDEVHHLDLGDLRDHDVVRNARIEHRRGDRCDDGRGRCGGPEARADHEGDQGRAHRRNAARGRGNRDRNEARDEHAKGQKQEAHLFQGLREERHEMDVALRERHHGRKAHRRADRDDEARVRHRLVELTEGFHRVEGKDRHRETGDDQNHARFRALDERDDRARRDRQSGPNGPGHGVSPLGFSLGLSFEWSSSRGTPSSLVIERLRRERSARAAGPVNRLKGIGV